MRASSRGTRDHDSVISGGAAPLPFVRRNESRPISRRRASAVGRPKSIAALIDTSGWRRTGARVPDWGWQRLFDESDTVATWPSAGQFSGDRWPDHIPIWSLVSSVRRAASGAPMSGQTLIGTKNQRLTARNRPPMKCGRVLRFGNRDPFRKLKSSRRANVFCSSLSNGHQGRVMSASCPVL